MATWNGSDTTGRGERGPLVLTENQALTRPYPYWMFLLEGIHEVNCQVIGYEGNLANAQPTDHGSYTYCDWTCWK